MTAFTAESDGRVCWSTTEGPVRFDAAQREQLLSLFESVGCPLSRHYHADLTDAHKWAGGIPVVSSFRRVA